MPRAFLPPFNEGTVLVSVILQPGISLAESDRIGRLAEELVAQVPEVKSVGRRTGRAELDEHAEGVHNSELDVDLETSERSREAILAEIRKRLSVLPASITVGQPIAHRLDHMLSGVRAQIALKIYGDDYDTLRGLAAELEAKLKPIPGVVDLQTEKQVRIPQLQVRVDYEKAKRYGLTPSAITEALETLSNGRVVSQIIDQSKRFDVVLRLSDEDRSTYALGEMLIESPAGRVPLKAVADVFETDGPNQIQRENGRRRIAVLANTDGSDMAKIIEAIRAELERAKLPQGYFTSLEGQFQAQEEASRRIAALSVVSLLLIFVVLYSRYRSAALALIIMGNVPLALHRQRGGAVDRRPAVLGRERHRLHHARGHRDAQRHPQDQPLHQSGAVRGRRVRPADGDPRHARTPDARADDGAGSRHRAHPADDRRRRARQGDPQSGRGDDLRRARLGDAARRLSHSRPVPASRQKAARTAFVGSKRAGPGRSFLTIQSTKETSMFRHFNFLRLRRFS